MLKFALFLSKGINTKNDPTETQTNMARIMVRILPVIKFSLSFILDETKTSNARYSSLFLLGGATLDKVVLVLPHFHRHLVKW